MFRVFFLSLVIASGCVMDPMSREELSVLKELQDLKMPVKKVVNPKTARDLNTFPGFGNMYLILNSEELGSQIFPGLLHMSLWPATIPLLRRLAFEDAEIINQRYTLKYYREGKGRDELERRKKDIEMMKKHDMWEDRGGR